MGNPPSLIAELDVPVREIDEVFPEVVLRRGKRDLDKRPPLGPLRFTDQAHVRFARKAVALARIAGDAGADHILPCRCSPAIARHNVIQIQFAAIKGVAAVLAGVLVALENVVTRKLHFLFRQPIKHQQNDYTRDTNLKRNRRDHLVVGRVRRQIAPALEVVRQKIVRLVGRDNLGVARIHQRESTAGGADVHRLPEAVEHQDLTV